MNNKDVKESFCGACLAIPIAFAGASASAYGSTSTRGKYKKTKQIALWGGIATIIISLIIAAYYLTTCSTCKQ